MRIALAQINPTLGDFTSNAEKILEFARRASEKKAHLVVFSELALFGYPPNDALEREEEALAQEKELGRLIKKIPKGITVIFGALRKNPDRKKGGKPFQNVAVVATAGKKPIFAAKQLLPSYDVFDETRFFEPGKKTEVVNVLQVGKVAVTVCEDMWSDVGDRGGRFYSCDPLAKLRGADLIVNLSASPFSKDKMEFRLKHAKAYSQKYKVPFVYVNQVGGQDELIFDGGSFILNEKGKVIVQAARCEEDLVMIDLKTNRSEHRPSESNSTETLRQALVLGLRDFVKKTGQTRVHLGLSGGIDSAVVASLAVDALGPGQVVGLLLPGPYSSQGSVDDSVKLAKNLGIKTYKVDINSFCENIKGGTSDFPQTTTDLPEQNLQSRLRGLVLMAYSNRASSMLLATSNKCELAAGYATLYGDTNGGLMPIGDLLKGEIYDLARHYNSVREIIPQEIIDKAPSAELAPGQKDSDSLPPYEKLDRLVEDIVEYQKPAKTEDEKWLINKLRKSEFKRWQSPPILRVSNHGFGRGRRFPISYK